MAAAPACAAVFPTNVEFSTVEGGSLFFWKTLSPPPYPVVAWLPVNVSPVQVLGRFTYAPPPWYAVLPVNVDPLIVEYSVAVSSTLPTPPPSLAAATANVEPVTVTG